MKTTKAQLYYDTLLIEALVSDNSLTKTAQSGMIGSIIDKVWSYTKSHIDDKDKVGSVVNILIPGALAIAGFPIIGLIVEIATSWFGLNLSKILEDIAGEIKGLISGGNKTNSGAVDGIVHRVFEQHTAEQPIEEQFEMAKHTPLKSLSMQQVKMYNLTLRQLMKADVKKQAGILSTLGRFVGLRSTTVNALTKVVGWVIKVILASAGFMVADDAIHGLVGVKSQTDFSSKQPDAPSHEVTTTSFSVPTQTTFKINPSYTEERLNLTDRWIEPVAPAQIGNEITQWTHDIYPDTKDINEDVIKGTSGFNKALQLIDEYNATNKLNVTFMPKLFSSRKKVVDLFIDELANKAPTSNPSAPVPNKSPQKFYDVTYK